jgi:uncharacterized sulfatase
MYDAELAYTDERVGELYDLLQDELGETVVVVTADHGELFGEDDMLGHKYSMHNALLQVPMVVQGIGGLNDSGLVQHADVVRTLVEVAGGETETIQGVDLCERRREYAISQSPEDSLDPLLEHNPDFETPRFPAEPYSVIQDGQFKYVQRPDEPRLYRLPDETENVANEHPDVVDKLNTELTEWLETEGQQVGEGEAIEVDKSTRERLADLGYLDSEM